MKEKVLEVIDRYGMLNKGDRVFIAVSGGQDSVSLLYFFTSIQQEWNLDLGLIHVNHLLRGHDSDKDDYYVKQLAAQYRLPFFSEKVDVAEYARLKRMSVEEAARACRFYCFAKIAKENKIQKVAIAHTRDDNAETVLMRILRGTGLKGLRAIQPVLEYDSVCFIRPFIECTGYQVKNYLRANKLKYRIDVSNRHIKYFRNKIRYELMPLLEQEYNPKAREALARMAETVYADYEYLSLLTEKEFSRVVKKENEGLVVLNRTELLSVHPTIRYRILEKVMHKIYPEHYFPYGHWIKVRKALETDSKFSMDVGHNLLLEVRRDEVLIQLKADKGRYEYYLFNNEEVYVKECAMTISLKEADKPDTGGGKNHAKPDAFMEVLDMAKLEFPLIVRNRRNGDRMEFQAGRHEKKIKDLMIDKKVPFYIRDEVPLILSKRKIIWCWGVGVVEDCRVTADTKKYLRMSIQVKS